ncbi:hypothetical protein Micbo1qcDRAFT_222519 [Microdochium bolleyi]|uniref:Uncharacterized protein n=1 Tax=Microdochium bolleyi TaxID=196109 RepID=A0A136J6F6_9PEZI|nr:hypothetical protein Micbo1qcDRAFT_222519 [Microdochium bolleyi]
MMQWRAEALRFDPFASVAGSSLGGTLARGRRCCRRGSSGRVVLVLWSSSHGTLDCCKIYAAEKSKVPGGAGRAIPAFVLPQSHDDQLGGLVIAGGASLPATVALMSVMLTVELVKPPQSSSGPVLTAYDGGRGAPIRSGKARKSSDSHAQWTWAERASQAGPVARNHLVEEPELVQSTVMVPCLSVLVVGPGERISAYSRILLTPPPAVSIIGAHPNVCGKDTPKNRSRPRDIILSEPHQTQARTIINRHRRILPPGKRSSLHTYLGAMMWLSSPDNNPFGTRAACRGPNHSLLQRRLFCRNSSAIT